MTRILVVEDSATQAAELRLILEAQGFEVETASDGALGLERLRTGHFDLVISDIQMPGLSGYEFCRSAKENPALKTIPIVLLTTLSDPLDVIQGLECGADNFLTKPFDPEQLVMRLRHVLDNRRLRDSGQLERGVEIVFQGRTFLVTSEKQQVVDLLISTLEDVVRKHRELHAATLGLESANRELEAFSYSVSHDLRTPLRHIDGFSQALLDDYSAAIDAKGQDYLRRVRAAAQRMAALIEDLLALSRVSRAEMRSQTIDVSALTRAIVANLQAAEPDRRVEVVIAAQLTCRGDRNLVAIVLENLLANAWKFTAKQEHARLEVGATQSGGEIAFYVRDNGAGFDMQYATKLFAPFQRLHAESDFPGTGVGLATVRRIVHRHGGRVWAESAPGQGATFYFTLTVAGG